MMDRRALVFLLAATGASGPARGQRQGLPLVASLHPGFPDIWTTTHALREGLAQAGLVDGKDVTIEARWGEGRPETLPALARELVALRPAVFCATARPAIEAALAATQTIPIVASDLESDPVAIGWAASLGHPGGNLTGVFLDAPSLCAKWLQQIGAVTPDLKRVSALWDVGTGVTQRDALVAAATAQGLDLAVAAFKDAAGLGPALDDALRSRPQAMVLLGSPLIRQLGPRVAQTLAERRIPAISPFRTFPDAGGLLSYGPDLRDFYRRVGPLAVSILRGARAGDVPIERPTKFEFILNLKAAKTLGIAVPVSIIAAADEVIE